MGGRSRKYTPPDRWDWLQEISDQRLERYGRMSGHKVKDGSADLSKFALHNEAASEFKRRHGYNPDWYYNPYVEPASDHASFYRKDIQPASGSSSEAKYYPVRPGQKIRLGDQIQSLGDKWEPVPASMAGSKVEKTHYPIRRRKQ